MRLALAAILAFSPLAVSAAAADAAPGHAARAAEPSYIIYPRNGQSNAQTDADRQACNQWAAAQPGASDASVFQRAFEACMDGRGYSVR